MATRDDIGTMVKSQSEFDAKEWLHRFESDGGIAWVPRRSEDLNIALRVEGFSDDQYIAAKTLYREIEQDEAKRAAVLQSAYWRDRLNDFRDTCSRYEQFLADCYRPLEQERDARWPNGRVLSGKAEAARGNWDRANDWKSVEDQAEAFGERIFDLKSELMSWPAPDSTALLWKLKQALSPENDGYTPSLAADYIGQTLADAERLLAV